MAKRSKQESNGVQANIQSSIPAAAVFSFLRDMSSEISWTLRNMEQTLKVPTAEARRITTIFEIQGYIKANGKDEWITTESGQEVSGAKFPRFTPEHVETALETLVQRIETANRDRDSPFKVTAAVAFGDFLRGGSRVQAADVGIALERRGTTGNPARTERHASKQFLKTLKGRITALNLKPFEPWMAAREHRKLF
jgi:hypothetical protein